MNFGPQTKTRSARQSPREAARRRNSECSRPTALTGRRRGAATNAPRRRPITVRCTAVGLLPLLREQFRLLQLILHLELRRRAASRRALPCPSSLIYNLKTAKVTYLAFFCDIRRPITYWPRERVLNGYERCSCSCCCYQIFNSLNLFHFSTDRN